MSPRGEERAGDVANVLFSSGWIPQDDGSLLIYYGSSDTRTHVAKTTVDKLIDYVKSAKPSKGFDEILIPGERAWRERSIREKKGIPVDVLAADQLSELAEQTGVQFFM